MPRRTLITSPFSGSLLQSAPPQLEQKHLENPSGGRYSRTSSAPESRRNVPGATRACAEAAVPVRRWQRVQWQYPTDCGGAVTS